MSINVTHRICSNLNGTRKINFAGIALAFFLALCTTTNATAATSITLEIGNPAYRALDRLAGLGLIDTYAVGQRPITRSEAARLLLEAEKNFVRLSEPYDKIAANHIIKFYKNIFIDDIELLEGSDAAKTWQIHPLEKISFNLSELSGPVRNIPFYGTAPSGAMLHPLAAYNGGRHITPGQNFAFETIHWISTPVFAAFAQPRFQFQASSTPNDEDKIFVQKLYAKAGFGDFELEAGRDELALGQGEFGGLLFSTNIRPMDIVKISTPYAFELPSFLNFLGSAKVSAFLSHLGPDYGYKNAKFTGGKLSLLPTPWLEAGIAYSLIAGGGGGVSDRMLNFDARARLLPASAAELYFEMMTEDEDFADRSSFNVGLYFPRLGNANNMAFRAEYFHTPGRDAKPATWTPGLTLNNELMGPPLGPNADAAYIAYYYDLGLRARFRLGFAYEQRGDNVTEKRYRPSAGLSFPLGGRISSAFSFGYERSSNFANILGQNKNGFLFGMNINLAVK